jgi:hypothetical protein
VAVTSKSDAARVLAYVAVLLEDNRLVKVQILSVLDHVNRKIAWNKVKGMTDTDFVVREREKARPLGPAPTIITSVVSISALGH